MKMIMEIIEVFAPVLILAVAVGYVMLFLVAIMSWHHISAARKEQRERLDTVLRGMQYICDKLAE